VPAETHSHRAAPDPADIELLVREQLAEILEIDIEAVTLDSRLREDLDADDYALLDLVDAIETELGERSVGLSLDEDLSELETVRDAIECVAARIAAREDAR
jgi:acyl carrier protein